MLAYLCALGAVIGFGTNFVPVKRYESSDGFFYQLSMCLGIFTVGCVVNACTGFSSFQPWAMLGGAIWACGNVLSVPIVKLIGLSQGLLIWGCSCMLVGTLTGSFHFFGLGHKKGVRVDPVLNYLGLLLGLVALCLYALIEANVNGDDTDKREEKRRERQQAEAVLFGIGNSLENGDVDTSTLLARATDTEDDCAAWTSRSPHLMSADPYMKKSTSNNALKAMHDQMVRRQVTNSAVESGGQQSLHDPVHLVATTENASHGFAAIDTLPTNSKRMLGIVLALIAGCAFGSNFDPELKVIADGGDSNSLHYVFSQFTGILLTSILLFLLYCAGKRNEPIINRELFVPAFFSGIIWGAAQVCWTIVQGALPQSVAFPLVTSGPGLVASLVGIFIFEEIKGCRNFCILLVAFFITAASIACIVLSMKKYP
eukprot:g1292.t1